MTRYRVRLFGRIIGKWWPTRGEAEELAIRRKLASRDEHSGIAYLGPSVEIEQSPPPLWQRRPISGRRNP